MDEDQFYPLWLYQKLVEDDLPWGNKSSYDLSGFLSKYTLHDSYWVGLFLHVAFDKSATLAFQWDSVWLPDEVVKGSYFVDDWPFLFIRINQLDEMSTANFVELDRVNRAIGDVEVLEIEGAMYLAVDDVYGGQVNLVFNGEYSILALNPDGSVLSI